MAGSYKYRPDPNFPTGVRRLPSASELALMQQLVAQAKGGVVGRVTPADSNPGNTPFPFPLPLGGLGFAFAGLLRSNRYGGTTIDVVSTRYEAVANATFIGLNSVNSAGASAPSGLPTFGAASGWNTQGSVDITNGTSTGLSTGSATLNEISTAQTRLSQVFMLGANDRYLSFTLSGSALDPSTGLRAGSTGTPQDAFEVALLDANTGLSVLGNDGLTRTDAFLNLQADGTQHTASCVTCINNADGSRTYRVDLTSVAKNTAVNLSFDLLGFGASNITSDLAGVVGQPSRMASSSTSHVTLRDIRTSGLPQLRDDVATLAEDNLLSFDPYAQADAALRPMLASSVVNAPTHGAITVNADGTFSYTPDLNYFGADSFSYRLSDPSTGSGQALDSNLATVSLTVTPVNDAPVVADVAATTAEDTALVIALGAYASDVDSTTLTIQIVAGPAHGVLVTNTDGTYSYTPDANYNGADSFIYKANDGVLDSNVATVSLNVTPVNDAPVAGDLKLSAVEDTALTINPLAAATDVENDPLTAAIVAGPQHGAVVFNADGTFTYTAAANYNGADSFTYQVNDGHLASDNGNSNIATVTLAVASVNDAPQGASNTVTTLEDTAYVFKLADFGFSDAQDVVAPAQVGAQPNQTLDSGLRRNDGSNNFAAVIIGALPQAGITNDLAGVVGQPSQMAITNHLAACCLSEMASCFTSSSISLTLSDVDSADMTAEAKIVPFLQFLLRVVGKKVPTLFPIYPLIH